MPFTTPTTIPGTDCIGNSLATINNNFQTLYNDCLYLKQTIAQLQNQPFSAKAWVYFNIYPNFKIVVKSQYNVSSVVRNGVGDYRVSFITPFIDTNYLGSGSTSGARETSWPVPPTIVPITISTAAVRTFRLQSTGDTQQSGASDLSTEGHPYDPSNVGGAAGITGPGWISAVFFGNTTITPVA